MTSPRARAAERRAPKAKPAARQSRHEPKPSSSVPKKPGPKLIYAEDRLRKHAARLDTVQDVADALGITEPSEATVAAIAHLLRRASMKRATVNDLIAGQEFALRRRPAPRSLADLSAA